MDLGPSDIKSLYTTLTNVEDSFRSMKSDLGMRPIYHQKDLGIRSHLYITVLAYHVLHGAINYAGRGYTSVGQV